MDRLFNDRRDAGCRLARRLASHAGTPDVVVLGLPRGGIPVAFEVARALRADLDVLVVRKLGMPSHPEVAIGAIAVGGIEVVDHDLVRAVGVTPAQLESVVRVESAELRRREQAYRGNRPPLTIAGRTVIVVDDGLATGATMTAALHVLRTQKPGRLIVAVPVAPSDTADALSALADEVVCLALPDRFRAVGLYYHEFGQTSDQEVRDLLARAVRAPRLSEPDHEIRIMSPLAAVRHTAVRLDGDDGDYDALLSQVAKRNLVLLGEATHGTREFYRMRAEISRRLIEEFGFEAVAVEADWPDAYALNRHVRGTGDTDALDAVAAFERFPEWMWRNREVHAFTAWLRDRNARCDSGERVGVYGLDLYSLYRSADAVIAYLEKVDPGQADLARRRYACLDHVRDSQQYGHQAAFHLRPPCVNEVTRQLADLRRLRSLLLNDSPTLDAIDEQFYAERNAVVVRNAESYYRAMFGADSNTWNLRDAHMADTLFALQAHLCALGGKGRIVVWAHNSHLGDARATAMGRAGEWNLGQLVRERAGREDALLVGFTTYTGFVSAAHEWGGHVERMRVRPALPESVEHLFQRSRLDRFYLPMVGDAMVHLREPMLERAIGVIYRPETERSSHYFETSLSEQFDAVFHMDETEAVEPLYEAAHWDADVPRDVPETYPFGV